MARCKGPGVERPEAFAIDHWLVGYRPLSMERMGLEPTTPGLQRPTRTTALNTDRCFSTTYVIATTARNSQERPGLVPLL